MNAHHGIQKTVPDGRHVVSEASPAPDLASSTDSYALRFSGPTGTWLLERQTRVLSELMGPWSRANVLDVGGGHAQVSPLLKAAGHEVRTLVSAEAAATRLERIMGDRAQILVGDLSALPLAERSVDVAVAFRMMAHMSDWRRFLAGLCRVSRDAVLIDFATPSGANALAPALFRAKKMVESDTRRFQAIPFRDVVEAFAELGFDVDAHVGQFVLPMALHRAVKRPGLSDLSEKALAPLASRFGNPIILRARRRLR